MLDTFRVTFPEAEEWVQKMRGGRMADWRASRLQREFPEAEITLIEGGDIYYVGDTRPGLSTYSEAYIAEMATRFDRFGTIYFFANKEDING